MAAGTSAYRGRFIPQHLPLCFDLAVFILMALMLFLSMICVGVDETLLQDAYMAPAADPCSRRLKCVCVSIKMYVTKVFHTRQTDACLTCVCQPFILAIAKSSYCQQAPGSEDQGFLIKQHHLYY